MRLPAWFSRKQPYLYLTTARQWAAAMLTRTGWGIRGKLIAIFVVIKVLPLVLLACLAWTQAHRLGDLLAVDTNRLTQTADASIADIGQLATADSMKALNNRMREEIERQTTDTARRIADFLHQRDDDIRHASSLEPDEKDYRAFLASRLGTLTTHGPWELAPDGKTWQPATPPGAPAPAVTSSLKDNERDFHYRPADSRSNRQARALYLEMSFVGIDGREKVKVSASNRLPGGLRDVSRRENTYSKAETYFADLKRLRPGEIYVSEVIGPYVGSRIIGHYTPETTKMAGLPYEPERAAYAGKENPVGQRFQGLVRWATPVMRGGRIAGYVTLALDHDHLMEFTNTLVPTAERYTDIPDAAAGNYAFIWDYRGRSIAHPRHHSIVGYRPDNGEPEVPWLESSIDEAWRKSGKPFSEFIAGVPAFDQQSRQKKQSSTLKKEGRVGLDCRYVNAAPQCAGWFDLTKFGGSGSFLIFWSGLWKITTAAAIPYYTGRYSQSPRGFGIVTIGANVDEFYRPAQETKVRIDQMVSNADKELARLEAAAQQTITGNLASTAWSLSLYTVLMSVLVIAIAVWMASYLTRRIRALIGGFSRFRQGETDFRFKSGNRDEMGALANAFDSMADTVNTTLSHLRREIQEHLATTEELRAIHVHLEQLVAQRTSELSLANERLHEEVEERRSAEERAQHLALHDPLTGLANRRQFHICLHQALLHARRTHKGHALLYFDLDRFKQVNDTLGHETGDALLQFVANTLHRCVRETDVVARLGGDEYAVLLNDVDSPDDSVRIANVILAQLRCPVILLGHSVQTATSIGITYFDDGGETPENLLRQADLAMYQAKQDGGNAYRFFVREMHERVRQREQMESDLRNALLAGQLLLYYQPRYEEGQSAPVAVEALIRWQHPRFGLLQPEDFLPLAESCGLLPEIDSWVIDAACRQAATWQAEGRELPRLAVNLTSGITATPAFPKNCLDILERHHLSPRQLDIEIVEQTLTENAQSVAINLAGLRQRGVRVALDDVGVQQFSLQHLIDCPIDILKLDRYFVSRLDEEKSRAAIKAVLALAHALGAMVVAEGVENEAQRDFLRQQGCTVMQGFLLGSPMTADELGSRLTMAASG